jgi:tetratricopeptide (TPR) repeat protein
MTSRTLGLVDHLLSRGRYFQQLGRTHDALRILGQLAGFRELPAEVAEEAQFRLGELQLRRKKHARARRHLAAALRHAPDNPRYHFLLARTLDNDRGDLARAAEHYRSSLALDHSQTDCLCAYGDLALRLGRTEEALECLRAAARLAPDDLKVLSQVVAGLRKTGLADEARGLLLAARFRNPRDGRYRRLWNDFQFDAARREQDARGGRAFAGDDGPVLLPFLRPVRPDTTPRPPVAGKIIRADAPAAPGPHLGQPARAGDQRQAQ